jgi:hypothetical protein
LMFFHILLAHMSLSGQSSSLFRSVSIVERLILWLKMGPNAGREFELLMHLYCILHLQLSTCVSGIPQLKVKMECFTIFEHLPPTLRALRSRIF